MKRMTILAAAGAALLVGCSGGKTDADGDGEISAKEVANKAEAEGIKPQPGLYKATITMTGIDIPGMPAEMKGHGAGATTTSEDCLTAEDVDKGFEELVKKGQNGECAYESFNLNGGNAVTSPIFIDPKDGYTIHEDGSFKVRIKLKIPDYNLLRTFVFKANSGTQFTSIAISKP